MISLNEPYIINDFSGGMIDKLSVTESLIPKNCALKAINCVFDRPRGAISSRLGSTVLGDTLTQIRGLFNFRDSGSGTDHRLLATNNSGTTYYLNGAVFTSTLVGDTPALKTRFVSFLDTVVRLNGTDQAQAWTGSGVWVNVGGNLDVGNWPLTKYGVIFKSRVYVAGNSTNPDRLYYCSIPSSGVISWTSGNGFIDINPNDGESGITGLGTNGTVLLAFKRNSIYRWDGTSTFADKVISIGTSSHESIATHDSGWVYFFGVGKNSIGAYRTSGGYPQKLSLPIERWFEAISPSYYDNVAGFCDDDHYYLSVGSITIDGQTYTNAWFVYTISSQVWHIEDRADRFGIFASYRDTNNNLTTVGGDTDGNVQTINSGTTDNGTPISTECELAPIIFTTRARTKIFGQVTTYASDFQGLQLALKTDDKDYQVLGEINKTEKIFDGISSRGLFRGKRFYPKIIATNSYDSWQFEGLEFNEINDEGFSQ